MDRYDARGQVGIVVATRGLTNEYTATVQPRNLRQEWSLTLERTRWTARGAWRARAGAVADLNYSATTGDAYSVHVGLGYSRRR